MELEGEWSELLYSYLTSAWYDWAVSNQLSSNNTHCWSVTAGYYSHYMLAASLLYMYRETFTEKARVKRIASNHSKLCNFLSNNKYNKEYSFRVQFTALLAEIMEVSDAEMDNMLKTIGDGLFSAKKARESHTYHVIVVSHQTVNSAELGNGEVVRPAKLVAQMSGTMLEIVPTLHTFVVTLLKKLLLNLDETIRHYHLKHLIQEIDDFYMLAKGENIFPLPASLESSLKELRVFTTDYLDNTKVENYHIFRAGLASFNEKKQDYQDLTSNYNYLKQALENIKGLKRKLQDGF